MYSIFTVPCENACVPVRGTYWDLLGEYTCLSCEFPLKIRRLTSQLTFAKDKLDIISEIETLARQVRETEAIRSKLHLFFTSDLMIERRHRIPQSEIQKFMGTFKDIFVTYFKQLRPNMGNAFVVSFFETKMSARFKIVVVKLKNVHKKK